MPSLSELLHEGFEAGLDRLDARLILQHATKYSHEDLVRDPHRNALYDQTVLFREMCQKRLNGIPLAYISQEKEFYGRDFVVEEGVLIPRPDTEILVETVLKWAKQHGNVQRIFDLGTGSGCIFITLLLELSGNVVGEAVEKSDVAIRIANTNLMRHNVQMRGSITKSNWLQMVDGKADIITSNPPYVRPADMEHLQKELSFEPQMALLGGEDGLECYRHIAQQVGDYLNDNGAAFFEIGHDQAEDVITIMQNSGLKHLQTVKDLANHDRVVVVQKN